MRRFSHIAANRLATDGSSVRRGSRASGEAPPRACASRSRASQVVASEPLFATRSAAPSRASRIVTPSAPSRLRQLFLEPLGLEVGGNGLDELVEVAVEDVLEAGGREADAMVGDARLREVVRPDLLGAVARSDHALALGGDRPLLLGLLDLEEPRLQHAHRLGLVLDLAALVLALDDEAGRQVRQAHGRGGGVDALASGTRRAETIHAYVFVAPLAVPVLGFSQDGDGGRGGVNAARGLRRRHPLNPVNASLVLELRVRALALDEDRDRLDAPDPRVVAVHDLDLPAPALGGAVGQAEERRGEERRLVAAGAGADLQEDVARVVGVLGQEQDLELLLDGRQPFGERGPLGGGHLVELFPRRQGLDELPGALQLLLDLPVLLGLSDDRLELGQGLLRVADGAVVLDEPRIREARPDLFVLAADFFQFFEHGETLGGQLSLTAIRTLSMTARERPRGRTGRGR